MKSSRDHHGAIIENDMRMVLAEAAEEVILGATADLIPMEVVSPPVRWSELDRLEPL